MMARARERAGAAVIACDGLSKTYGEGHTAVRVLSGVRLELRPGEKVAIVGASGSGKSTLLHLLGGLDTPDDGQVLVKGRDMAAMTDADRSRLRNEALGFIYQFHHLLPEFTALENVAMPLLIRGLGAALASTRATGLLERVGLMERIHHKPSELSGGERQRVAIARALVTEPDAVLADEPTGNLDRRTADQVFELMVRLNRELHTTLVIVTHDTRVAEQMDLTYVLEDGALHRSE